MPPSRKAWPSSSRGPTSWTSAASPRGPGIGRPSSAEEEIRRVVPLIQALRDRGAGALSVDTTKAEVAAAALDAGADLVNDVSGFAFDPALAPLVARRGVPAVVMHLRGDFAAMHREPQLPGRDG